MLFGFRFEEGKYFSRMLYTYTLFLKMSTRIVPNESIAAGEKIADIFAP